MKFYKWLFIVAGIITILNLGGFTTNSGGIVEQLLNGGLASLKSTQFYSQIAAILVLAVTGAIIAGLITRSFPTEYIMASFVTFLMGAIMADVIGIFTTIWGFGITWIQAVASLIFVPFVFAFMISFIDWWRGTDL